MDTMMGVVPFLTLLIIFLNTSTGSGDICMYKPDGYYINKSTCYGYIQCKDNTAIYFDCLPGLVWNNEHQLCTNGVCLQQMGMRSVKFRKNMKFGFVLIKSSTTKSRVKCAGLCLMKDNCQSFSWSGQGQECKLYDICNDNNTVTCINKTVEMRNFVMI